MKTTRQSLDQEYRRDEFGYVFDFGDGYKLRFEQLLFDKQMYVALYKDQSLLTEKVVVKPGFIKNEEK